MYTIDSYWSNGYLVTVRENGSAYITFGPCSYREFASENAARRWAEKHMKWDTA